MKRLKKKQKKQPLRPKTICPNCGEIGPHFVPPFFGDEGFFICEPKAKTNQPLQPTTKSSADTEAVQSG